MVKVTQMDLPPGSQALLDKILAWFDNQIYPTWATRYFHKTRTAKKANKEKTYMPGVRSIWSGFTPAQKALWSLARQFGYRSSYALFTADYSYRRKHGLSLPGTPNNYHQMYGLQMFSPSGQGLIQGIREDIVLTGPITISFNYRQVYSGTYIPEAAYWADPIGTWADSYYRWVQAFHPEWADALVSWADPSFQWAGPVSFSCNAVAYYFSGGRNLTTTGTTILNPGNLDWSTATISLGVPDKQYFHLVTTFNLYASDIEVDLDNILIQDKNGDIYREPFKLDSKGLWAYPPHYRKEGWHFSPEYREPFFNVIYLG